MPGTSTHTYTEAELAAQERAAEAVKRSPIVFPLRFGPPVAETPDVEQASKKDGER